MSNYSYSESLPPLQPGDLLNGGEYRIVSETVNQGGFGRIYRAVNTKGTYRRKYAVKEFCLDEQFEQRTTMGDITRMETDGLVAALESKFFMEAKALFLMYDNVQHSFVPQIYSYPCKEEDGRMYYLMEYVEGPTLTEEIENWGPMPEERALGFIKVVCHTLEHAHNLGLTHSDVNPNNIILKEYNYPVLLDFGNARNYSAELLLSNMNDRMRQGFGPYQEALERAERKVPELSDYYLEQLNNIGTQGFSYPYGYAGQVIGDVYSVAATLFFMLTGEKPNPSESYMQWNLCVMKKHGVTKRTRRVIINALTLQTESVSDFMHGLRETRETDINLRHVL